jgi:hypothetical protein
VDLSTSTQKFLSSDGPITPHHLNDATDAASEKDHKFEHDTAAATTTHSRLKEKEAAMLYRMHSRPLSSVFVCILLSEGLRAVYCSVVTVLYLDEYSID